MGEGAAGVDSARQAGSEPGPATPGLGAGLRELPCRSPGGLIPSGAPAPPVAAFLESSSFLRGRPGAEPSFHVSEEPVLLPL